MKIKFRKRVTAAVLMVALALGGMQPAVASTMSKAKDAKNKAQKDLDDATNQIQSIEKQQRALQSEIDEKDQELVNLLVNIDILKDELDAKNKQLETVTAELGEAQKTERQQYASMKKRIQFMYERGDNAMLDALLGAEDMSDFLNRVEYVSEVYSYDRKLLTKYQDTVQQVAELKSNVETEKAELEDMQDEYAAQQTSLESILAEKKAQMGNYDNQLATAQAAAAEFKKTIDAQNQIIKQEEEKQKEAERKAAAAAAAAAAKTASTKSSAKGQSSAGTGTDSAASSDSSAGTSGSSGADSGSTAASGGANPSPKTGVSGSSVVSYACQFVGNPYVWGGTSLTNGADCSGFVMSVFANFGISLPHSSAAMQGCGQAVSYANAQPGDLICYSGHVAIYMGGGQIVHAQSAAVGITTSSATYRTIVAVRRVL